MSKSVDNYQSHDIFGRIDRETIANLNKIIMRKAARLDMVDAADK